MPCDEMRWDEPSRTVDVSSSTGAGCCCDLHQMQFTTMHSASFFRVLACVCIIIVMIMVKHASYQHRELHLRRTWNVQMCIGKSRRESKWFIILLTKSFYYFFSSYVNCYVYEWKLKVRKHEMCNFFYIPESSVSVCVCFFFLSRVRIFNIWSHICTRFDLTIKNTRMNTKSQTQYFVYSFDLFMRSYAIGKFLSLLDARAHTHSYSMPSMFVYATLQCWCFVGMSLIFRRLIFHSVFEWTRYVN